MLSFFFSLYDLLTGGIALLLCIIMLLLIMSIIYILSSIFFAKYIDIIYIILFKRNKQINIDIELICLLVQNRTHQVQLQNSKIMTRPIINGAVFN